MNPSSLLKSPPSPGEVDAQAQRRSILRKGSEVSASLAMLNGTGLHLRNPVCTGFQMPESQQ